MSDVLKFRSRARIEEEAAAWVWRLDDEEVSPQQRREFEQWLRRDPRHRRAFEELGGVWNALDELAEAKRDEKVATFVAEEQRLYATAPAKRKRGGLRRFIPWAIAASLAVGLGMLSWLQRGNEAQTLATAVGQQRSARLADGSVVQLNTNTILETHFDGKARAIHLRKGEASFKVTKDAERPFLVYAGGMVVRAVGTEFNVRMRDSLDIEVIVAEGTVAVEAQLEPEPALQPMAAVMPEPRELTTGQRFETVTPAEPVARITPEAISDTLAWREGAVVFNGEPLVQAIAELNRYTDVRLVVADPAIHDLRVGGRFRAGDVDGFLEALTRAFPVRTRLAADNLVYIEAQTASRPRRQ